MDNHKLLDVTNYYLENAHNGILNVYNNKDYLKEENYDEFLSKENISKVCCLVDVVKLDIQQYLKSSIKYLEEKIKKNNYIDEMRYECGDDYYICDTVKLKQYGAGRRINIIFTFYISFYYTKDDFMGDELNQPIITFELYLDSEGYDVEALRKINHPGKYKKMQECFDNIGNHEIYAYEKIDYNQNLTSKEVSDKAAKFLEKYLKDKFEDIRKARY